jgi:hypothetical protein
MLRMVRTVKSPYLVVRGFVTYPRAAYVTRSIWISSRREPSLVALGSADEVSNPNFGALSPFRLPPEGCPCIGRAQPGPEPRAAAGPR